MDMSLLYVSGVVVLLSGKIVITSEGYCGKKFKNGKWESQGDCNDSTKSSILKGLDDKLETVCYMGLKSRTIQNSAITASSTYGVMHESYQGRLDNKQSATSVGAWCVHTSKLSNSLVKTQWIQVDFGSILDIAGVITQGDPRPWANQWTTSYKVSCGKRQSEIAFVTESGSEKVFTGNQDYSSKVYNRFPQIVKCRFIRIYPQTYNNWACVRMEFVAGKCFDFYRL